MMVLRVLGMCPSIKNVYGLLRWWCAMGCAKFKQFGYVVCVHASNTLNGCEVW
jgi:hypothetical protein